LQLVRVGFVRHLQYLPTPTKRVAVISVEPEAMGANQVMYDSENDSDEHREGNAAGVGPDKEKRKGKPDRQTLACCRSTAG
jgi:hypothetical protein